MTEDLKEDQLKLKRYMMGKTMIGEVKRENNRVDFFIMRGANIAFKYPHKILDILAKEVAHYFDLKHPITHKARYTEIVDARRMFIFFATLYLKLNTSIIAKYLGLERSTLSHHMYKATANIRIFSYDRLIANDLDKFMHKLQSEMQDEMETT